MSPFSIFNRHPANDLAAYADGELSPARRARIEDHVESCPACAADLEGIRQAKAALEEMPLAEAPRSFALTPEMAERPVRRAVVPFASSGWGNGMRAASAGFAMLFAAVFAIDAVGTGTDTGSDDSGGVPANYEVSYDGDAAAPEAAGDDAGEDDAGDDAGSRATQSAGIIGQDSENTTPTETAAGGVGGLAEPSPAPTADSGDGAPGGVGGGGGGAGGVGGGPDATDNVEPTVVPVPTGADGDQDEGEPDSAQGGDGDSFEPQQPPGTERYDSIGTTSDLSGDDDDGDESAAEQPPEGEDSDSLLDNGADADDDDGGINTTLAVELALAAAALGLLAGSFVLPRWLRRD